MKRRQLSETPQPLRASSIRTNGPAGGGKTPPCTQRELQQHLRKTRAGAKLELEWIKICLAAFCSPVNVGCGCGLAQIRETQEGHRRWGKEAVKILS